MHVMDFKTKTPHASRRQASAVFARFEYFCYYSLLPIAIAFASSSKVVVFFLATVPIL